MTPADKRITELLDRWLTSIELHLKYVDLDEASYRAIQPWPEHERPVRWVLEAAQQKVLQLKALTNQHIASQDPSFTEGLELMAFLANLVGSQNVRRFVPIADLKTQRTPQADTTTATTQAVISTNNAKTHMAQKRQSAATEATNAYRTMADEQATRELPTLTSASKKAAKIELESTREMPRLSASARTTAVPRRAATRTAARPATHTATNQSANTTRDEIVIADAVRLLKWGRQWHELIELIARMAERPAPAEIRRILRQHKAAIELQLR